MKRINSNRGSAVITTPLVIAISLFFFSLLTVFCINFLMPFIWYEKLSSQSLKYIFVMEEYGYLTQEERNNITSELVSSGFDTDSISVSATEIPSDYGDPIYLDITYNYRINLPMLNSGSLSATNQSNIIQMNVRRQSVSKR